MHHCCNIFGPYTQYRKFRSLFLQNSLPDITAIRLGSSIIFLGVHLGKLLVIPTSCGAMILDLPHTLDNGFYTGDTLNCWHLPPITVDKKQSRQ